MNHILCVLALSFLTNKPNKCVQQCFAFGSINQCPACKWGRWTGAHSNQLCTGKAAACGKEERRSSLLLSEKLLSMLSFKEPLQHFFLYQLQCTFYCHRNHGKQCQLPIKIRYSISYNVLFFFFLSDKLVHEKNLCVKCIIIKA